MGDCLAIIEPFNPTLISKIVPSALAIPISVSMRSPLVPAMFFITPDSATAARNCLLISCCKLVDTGGFVAAPKRDASSFTVIPGMPGMPDPCTVETLLG